MERGDTSTGRDRYRDDVWDLMPTSFDTNVVLRLLVVDDPAQGERAAQAYRRALAGDGVFITVTVLVEVAWVLRVSFKLDRGAIAAALRKVVRADGMLIECLPIVRRAITAYEAGAADFADYVVLESSRDASALPVMTFDEKLAREPDVQLVPL